MRVIYKISSNEIGMVLIRRRKIAKALRWWLRENGFNFQYTFFQVETDSKTDLSKDLFLENSAV
ncbi:MAG: hypothetical protein LLG13_08175 [Bacteroidales bacterium]|nr:hypothetical protein [Bacteroidales bacterium]